MSVPTNVGRTKSFCPVASTRSTTPSTVKPAWVKTPSVRSTRTVPAATGNGAPLIAANRARTMSPPTAAEGTSVLTDSPIQRIQSSFHSDNRSEGGNRTHHCGNSPAGVSEGSADLVRALPDKQDCEKCGSSKTKQPYSYLDFSRRFHRVFESNSSRRKKMRLCFTRNSR